MCAARVLKTSRAKPLLKNRSGGRESQAGPFCFFFFFSPRDAPREASHGGARVSARHSLCFPQDSVQRVARPRPGREVLSGCSGGERGEKRADILPPSRCALALHLSEQDRATVRAFDQDGVGVIAVRWRLFETLCQRISVRGTARSAEGPATPRSDVMCARVDKEACDGPGSFCRSAVISSQRLWSHTRDLSTRSRPALPHRAGLLRVREGLRRKAGSRRNQPLLRGGSRLN